MINLDQQPNYLDLDTPWPQQNQDPEVINNKTQRYAYGMSPLIDSPTISNYLTNGMENDLRVNAAAKVNQETTTKAADDLRKGVTPQLDIARPTSVVEQKFGQKLADNYYQTFGEDVQDDNGTFSRITEHNPELTKAALKILADQSAYSESIYNELQDASKEAETQLERGERFHTVDFGQLKDLLGVTGLYTERGVVPGTFWQGGLLGSNLEAQRKALESIPDIRDRIDALKKASKYLRETDPKTAVHFLTYMYQPSVLKQNFDNLTNTVDVAGLLGVGKLGINQVKSWMELQRMMWETAGKHPEMTIGNMAATAADAVGRPEEAGKIAATTELKLRGSEHPQATMERGMASVFQTRKENILKGGAGNAGSEVQNRIIEDIDKGSTGLINRSANINKIIRIGDTLQLKQVLDKGYEELMTSRPWTYDMTLNVGPFKTDFTTSPPAGSIRFYHGGDNPGSGGGRWVSEDMKYARDYRPGQTLHYVDIPESDLQSMRINKTYDDTGTSQRAPYVHFEAPERFAKQMKPVGSSPVSKSDLIKFEPHTATFWADQFLGREDGSFFNSVAEAVDKAKAKGLEIYSIHGVPTFEGESGAAVHEFTTRPHPGSAKSLGDLLQIAAKDPNISYKGKENLERLAITGAGEPVNFSKMKLSTGQVLTSIRPANGVYGQGKGFYIALPTPLRETSHLFRDMATQTPAAMKSNKGWLNSWGLGRARTPDEVLNAQITKNRKVAVYGPALLQHEIVKILQPYDLAKAPLRGRTWSEVRKNFGKASRFEELLRFTQDNQKDFASIPELEGYWHQRYGEMPDEVIVRGYFSKKAGDDADHALRSVKLTTNMTNHGVERHKLLMQGPDGKPIESPEFMGVAHKEVPQSDYAVAMQRGNEFKVKEVRNLTTKEDLEMKEKIKTGEIRFIELYNASLQPLNEFLGIGDRYIKYVATPITKSRPLGHFSLPQKEGGHLMYPYSNWIHQANIKPNPDGDRYHYLNDINIMAAESRALGEDVSKGLNVIRQHLLNEDKREGLTAAKAAMYEHHLPFSWREVRANFRSGRWNLNEPFYNVPDGKTIADIPNHFEKTYGNAFREAARGGSLDKQFAVEFTGERDAYDVFAIHSEGTYTNPTLAFRPADKVDPFTSLNRSLHRIIQSTYMDDVKITSVNDWLQRNISKFDNLKESEVFNNPWYSFYNGELKKGLGFYEKAQLEAERYQIKSFVGVPSWWDQQMHAIEQRMADAVYKSETKLGRRANLVAKWSVDKAMKTPDFLRSVVYRSAIGLFAPAQFAVQLMTYASIFGIAGVKRAGQGSIGALLHQISRLPQVTPNILKGLDRLAVNLGHFRPGEWLEAYTALNNSGFQHVGRETNTLRAGIGPTKVIQSTWGRILDSGELFFNAGERHTRYGAFYTAYAEHRETNPTGRLTMSDRNTILNRADDLSGNMTRASRSTLQGGPLSFPTQFLGYWLRTLELMGGKRLTRVEKARMFAVYGAMFGFIPGAVGLTALSPLSETWSKYAEQAGYIPGGSKIADTFFQGIGHMMLQAATGNQYNFGERYGPGPGRGFDFLTSDKPFWTSFTGPLGDMVGQTLGNIEPFYRLGADFVNGRPTARLSADDWVKPFQVLNVVNSAEKAYVAYNYHNWISRNGNVMEKDVTPANSFFMAMSGLQPSSSSRMQVSRNIAEDREYWEKKAESLAKTEYRRFFRDLGNKDYDAAAEHQRNASVYLDGYAYPLAQRPQLWSEIAQENQNTLPDRMLITRYLGKHVPMGQERESVEKFGREMEILKGQK